MSNSVRRKSLETFIDVFLPVSEVLQRAFPRSAAEPRGIENAVRALGTTYALARHLAETELDFYDYAK